MKLQDVMHNKSEERKTVKINRLTAKNKLGPLLYSPEAISFLGPFSNSIELGAAMLELLLTSGGKV